MITPLVLIGKVSKVMRVLKGMVLVQEDEATQVDDTMLNREIEREKQRILAFLENYPHWPRVEIDLYPIADGLANHLVRNRAQVEAFKKV